MKLLNELLQTRKKSLNSISRYEKHTKMREHVEEAENTNVTCALY